MRFDRGVVGQAIELFYIARRIEADRIEINRQEDEIGTDRRGATGGRDGIGGLVPDAKEEERLEVILKGERDETERSEATEKKRASQRHKGE